MHRDQSPMTSESSDARRARIIAMMLSIGIVGALVLPIWTAALVMLGALAMLRLLTTPEPAVVPVVIRREDRW
jgi:hypothetical protein